MDAWEFLLIALEQAWKGRGECAPNPAVGAIVVKDNRIIAKGFHRGYGQAHAEVEVLNSLSLEDSENADLYVTLEPCCHWGKTPPCSDLIISKKISRVFYAYKDPNPVMNGKGAAHLTAHGINCIYQPCDASNDFYSNYAYWWQQHRPKVTAKIAISLDGKIAHEGFKPAKLTGKAAQIYTHQQRKIHDGILTTLKTIINDDPQLNVRLNESQPIAKNIYILDSKLEFPLSSKILTTAKKITLFYAEEFTDAVKIHTFKQNGIECVPMPMENNLINLNSVLNFLGEQGLHDLWVEAGGNLLQQLCQQNLLHQLLIYVAPKVLGVNAINGLSADVNFSQAKSIQWQILDNDSICVIQWD